MRDQYLQLLKQHYNLMSQNAFRITEMYPEDYAAIAQALFTPNELLDLYANLLVNALTYAKKSSDQKACATLIGREISDLESGNEVSESMLLSLFELHNKVQTDYHTAFAARNYQHYAPKDSVGSCPFTGKGVVYTVITGQYDQIKAPEFADSDLDYIAVTDNPNLSSDFWKIRLISNPEVLSEVKLARKNKILCQDLFPEYDYSIYIDGKVLICGNMKDYIAQYSLGRAMLCFPHFSRENVLEECKELTALQKDDPSLMLSQVSRYLEEGFPTDYPLVDTCILVRDHKDPALKNAMNTWWQEVKNNSYRDQLSFGYSCWKNSLSFDLCDLYCGNNPYAVAGDHNQT